MTGERIHVREFLKKAEQKTHKAWFFNTSTLWFPRNKKKIFKIIIKNKGLLKVHILKINLKILYTFLLYKNIQGPKKLKL